MDKIKFPKINYIGNKEKLTKWICDKMSTDKGFPFFLYSSLYTDKLILRNLEQLLRSPPINPGQNQEYHYGQSRTMNDDPNLARKVIVSAKLGKSEDLFKIIEKGHIGSDICYLNTALPDASTEIRFDYDVVKIIINLYKIYSSI